MNIYQIKFVSIVSSELNICYNLFILMQSFNKGQFLKNPEYNSQSLNFFITKYLRFEMKCIFVTCFLTGEVLRGDRIVNTPYKVNG